MTKEIKRDAYHVKETCEKLSISRATLYRLAKARKIKIVKLGGRSVVPSSEIVRVLTGEVA